MRLSRMSAPAALVAAVLLVLAWVAYDVVLPSIELSRIRKTVESAVRVGDDWDEASESLYDHGIEETEYTHLPSMKLDIYTVRVRYPRLYSLWSEVSLWVYQYKIDIPLPPRQWVSVYVTTSTVAGASGTSETKARVARIR
jgi:hypothetical protein